MEFFCGFHRRRRRYTGTRIAAVALERNTYRAITTEQDATIRRYEAIAAGYEELTAELFEMLEGGEE